MGGKRNIGFYKKARESLVRAKSPGNDCLREFLESCTRNKTEN